MLSNSVYNTNMKQYFDKKELEFWFDVTKHKFLQNIDTFYYSVKLDLSTELGKTNFDNLVSYLSSYTTKEDYYSYCLSEINSDMTICNGYFASYSYRIKVLDLFDIFVLRYTDNNTSEILVQIRSYPLWLYGADSSMNQSLDYVHDLINYFNLSIDVTKINRLDFCWHTNYFECPERFFNIENISKNAVCRFKDVSFHYEIFGNESYEVDYLRLGNLKSKNYIFRAYNKTKEVIEQNYKPWFLKLWLLHKLINRYDFYCLEKCYKKRDYRYLDLARLEFFKENCSNASEFVIKKINSILDGTLNLSYDEVHSFADSVTPHVTIIVNNEFQCMRKFFFSGTCRYIDFKNIRNRKGFNKEIEIIIDNRVLITDFLTSSCLRFVKSDRSDRKERTDYSNFWKRLRCCKIVDFQKNKHNLTLVRKYHTEVSKEFATNAIVNSLALLNVYNKRIESDFTDDILNAISLLNDNDVYKNSYRSIKMFKNKQLSTKIVNCTDESKNFYHLVDKRTGEIL